MDQTRDGEHLAKEQTQGVPWSAQERIWHISCLKLLAATLALKTFAKNERDISVLLKIDKTTDVAYKIDKTTAVAYVHSTIFEHKLKIL